MSLVIVWVSQDRALICVDTFAGKHDGGFVTAPKMTPLVHANLMLAVQGKLDLLPNVWGQIATSGVEIDFDRLEDDLAKMLPPISAALVQLATRDGLDPNSGLFAPSKFFLVGWSNGRKSMAALCFEPALDGDAQMRVTEAKPWLVVPGVPALRNAALQPTDDGFRAIAEAQVRHYVSQPSVAIGGTLLMAELTRSQMNIRSLGSL